MKRVFGCLFIVLVLYISSCIYKRMHYENGFENAQLGDYLPKIIEYFGRPDLIESGIGEASGYDAGARAVCGGKCWLRFGYVLPFSFRTKILIIDFDMDRKVIYLSRQNSD